MGLSRYLERMFMFADLFQGSRCLKSISAFVTTGLLVTAPVFAGSPGEGNTETSTAGPHPGFHNGIPFAYEEGLLDYVRFPRAWLAEHGVDVHASLQTIYQAIFDPVRNPEEDTIYVWGLRARFVL